MNRPSKNQWILDRRRREIEEIARSAGLERWRKMKAELGHTPEDPTRALEPCAALAELGYEIQNDDCGLQRSEDGHTEVAGWIDNGNKIVRISPRFSFEVQRFTAAHELGHALLHPDNQGVLRDLPTSGPRDRKEWFEREADLFAAAFLMPRALLKQRFENCFLTAQFVLDEATAFALCRAPLDSVCERLKAPRDLARVLAETTSYNSRSIEPLKSQFRVSSTAMATRINELGFIS